MSAVLAMRRLAARFEVELVPVRVFKVQYTRFGFNWRGRWHAPQLVAVAVSAGSEREAKAIVRRRIARGEGYSVYPVVH